MKVNPWSTTVVPVVTALSASSSTVWTCSLPSAGSNALSKSRTVAPYINVIEVIALVVGSVFTTTSSSLDSTITSLLAKRISTTISSTTVISARIWSSANKANTSASPNSINVPSAAYNITSAPWVRFLM